MEHAAARGIPGRVAGAAPADLELAGRLAAGEPAAVAAVCTAHSRALLAYIRHFVADPALAEEVVQDTLVAAWQSARRFEGRSSLRTWLLAIARRQALMAVRRRRLPVAGPEVVQALVAEGPGPEETAVDAVRRREVLVALGALSAVHREVLILTFVHGLSYPELAAVLAVPVGTVKSRLSNARRAMRAILPAPDE